jgi:hypothetical protein
MEQQNQNEPNEIQVMDSTAIQSITSAEIDVQIATAHKYPRSLAQFVKRATEMATLDVDTAAACIYRKPVGKNANGSVKYAEGKSVRLAEIVGACYGNLRVGSMLVEQDARFVKSRGFAHDLETNFASSSECVEATVYSSGTNRGKPYTDQMRITIAKATLAKARRDATFQVVPGALCKSIELAARKTAIGTAETLGARRLAVMDWISKAGVSEERFFHALGIGGVDDIGADILATITGIRTALKDGDTTFDEAFPELDKNSVSAPRSKSESTAAPAQTTEVKPAEPDARKEYQELDDLAKRASKKVQDKIKDIKEAFCKKHNTTPDDFTQAQLSEIVPQLREVLI